MTRRSERRNRRELKRFLKTEEYRKLYDNFENLTNFEHLYNSTLKASKGVSWKVSVQRYVLSALMKTVKLQNELKNHKDVRKGFIEFFINERGKERFIQSVHISERVVQKCLCHYILYPLFTKSLIYDNSASQKGKGTSFAINRLKQHLRNHYQKYGNKGYILLIDFKSFFANINHDILKMIYRKYIKDPFVLKYTDDFVDAFGDKGLGLGSETSQLHSILYANAIDHYIKEVLKVKGYGRYMDDSYILCNDKKALEEILTKLRPLYEKNGIMINDKKTYITDLKHGFKFLKTRFYLMDNGKLILKPLRRFITLQRRKLKRQAKLGLNKYYVERSMVSWQGSMSNKNAYQSVQNMNKLYKELWK